MLDGVTTYSCSTLTQSVRDRKITTIEGIAGPNGGLHKVQEAMIAELGPQCGFCTTGQVVAAVALLKHNPHPTLDEARRGMSGNLCRCGAYDHYLKASHARVGGGLNNGKTQLIGKNFRFPMIVAKVTGRAKYAEDFRADDMVFCKTLTSPIPHAKIRSIDTSEALKMPGVLGILTADDVPQFPPPPAAIFAKDETFYVGDPILAMAAAIEDDRGGRDRSHQDRFPATAACGRPAGKPVSRAAPTPGPTAMSRPARSSCRPSNGRRAISQPTTPKCRWAGLPRNVDLWRCRCRHSRKPR